jgi:hypothetical protein
LNGMHLRFSPLKLITEVGASDTMSPVNKGQNRKNDREGDTQLRQNQVDFRDDPPKT